MFDINPGNQRKMTVSYTNAVGDPGAIEGQPAWEVSDPSLLGLAVDSDGMGAMLTHIGGSGDVTVTVRADGDLGAGIFAIVLAEDFSMLAPLGAIGGNTAVGDETPIP